MPDHLAWRKATRSEPNNCVEIARDGDLMRVRDTKHPTGPILSFNRGEWEAFLAGAADGEMEWDA